MRWIPVIPALLGLLYFTSTTALASELSASQLSRVVERCIDKQFHAGQATTRGKVVKLQKSCPSLAKSRNHSLLKNIQPPLAKEITVSQLLDIRTILQARTRTAASVRHNDYPYAGLDNLLKDTYVPSEEFKPDPTLWQRFFAWLRKLLTPEDRKPPAWLEDFFDSIELPETDTVILFLKGAVALLVLLTLLMIFNELRAANVLSAWRHIKRQRQTPADELLFASDNEALSVSHIKQLPDKQFASKLLYLTLVNLMQRRILPQRFSLTNRELLSQLPQDESKLLPALHQLIQYTDAGLYGDRQYETQQRQQMLQLSDKLTAAGEETS
jgi:hypothetical protein